MIDVYSTERMAVAVAVAKTKNTKPNQLHSYLQFLTQIIRVLNIDYYCGGNKKSEVKVEIRT